MDEQEQTEEEWSGYCVKHRDDILRMMIDVARLLFGNRPARELPTVFKPPFGKSELFSLESDDVQIECDELIAGFPESSRTLEPVHAAMEEYRQTFGAPCTGV
ncbi:MAG: hypothetical protein HS101_07980 [Planctomycetia bacterium]|nr:hypothetical protein [Planctomycetia bacterium]